MRGLVLSCNMEHFTGTQQQLLGDDSDTYPHLLHEVFFPELLHAQSTLSPTTMLSTAISSSASSGYSAKVSDYTPLSVSDALMRHLCCYRG